MMEPKLEQNKAFIRNHFEEIVKIRDYIAERCRILAVVGLRGNTFKPLEIAKTGVERAIEQTEERAIEWMNQQLEALGINL